MDAQTVKLKNGSEEFGPLVTGTMLSLRTLMEQDPISFYELVMLARNPQHQLFGNTGERLAATALLGAGDGRFVLHSSIRAIVLSAVEGDGLEMTLGSPYSSAS